jgi:UDP-N-acetylmuramoyl-tripeptide--D-alanyl-D-alanine ligase
VTDKMNGMERRLTLTDLVLGLAGTKPPPSLRTSTDSALVCQAVVDSRLVSPGCLFVALQGEHRDGHQFIAEAIARGAVGVIAERVPASDVGECLRVGKVEVYRLGDAFCLVVPNSLEGLQRAAAHWRQVCLARVIGITGSVGKTTSREAIAAVLSQRYATLKSEENYNNEIGLPLTLLHLTDRHERAVLEMGTYALGEIAHLAQIAAPQVGVVTNVGPTHLERLGTIERITLAKAELLHALPSIQDGGIAILNADDPHVRSMSTETRAQVMTYGLTATADLWADQVTSHGLDGIHFRLHAGDRWLAVESPLLGRHSVYTALCAAAVGLAEGLTWEQILAGLQGHISRPRLTVACGPAGSTILDDTYNASPVSCLAALDLLGELPGRKIAVLGDMYELGSYEQEGHKVVGRHACKTADLLVAVGPRGRVIGLEAMRAGMAADAVHLVASNAQATDLLRRLIGEQGSGDRILIKGSRGMEMDEIVEALTQPGGHVSVTVGGKQP